MRYLWYARCGKNPAGLEVRDVCLRKWRISLRVLGIGRVGGKIEPGRLQNSGSPSSPGTAHVEPSQQIDRGAGVVGKFDGGENWLIILDNTSEETAVTLGDVFPRRNRKGRILYDDSDNYDYGTVCCFGGIVSVVSTPTRNRRCCNDAFNWSQFKTRR